MGFISRFFCKEVFIIATEMKSQKFIACFKSQKSLKEDVLKQQFFDEVMEKIQQQLTAEEHEYLITFILQNKIRERPLAADNSAPYLRPAPASKNDDSPLIHIKEDVFRDVKRSIKRIVTLTPDAPATKQHLRLNITSTASKKIRPREHFHTVFANQENQAPCSPIDRTNKGSSKQFKVYPLKKATLRQSKSCERILKDRKVLEVYNNQFLRDIFGDNGCAFPDEFSERFLMTAPQPGEKAPVYARLRTRQLAEEERLRSINCLQFGRTPGRSRTAIKLHSRKY